MRRYKEDTGPKVAKLYVEGPWIVCKTPYLKAFVEDLKDEVSHHNRKWDANDKVWKVDVDELDKVDELCRKHFDEVTFIETEQPSGEGAPSPYHDMLCDAPDETLKRVYRLIAVAVHPDQGGDPAIMSKVNDAWRMIQKERKI
jgi:hypothetical protein